MSGPGPDVAERDGLLRGWIELVADAVAGLDEGVRRGARVDLLTQFPDEDVDGAVPVRCAPAPYPLQQLVAGEHAALVERERVDEPELGRCQLRARAVDVRLNVARVEPELLDLDLLAAARLLPARPARRRRRDAGRQLLHRERLDQIVVGPQLERVDAVVLGAAGADDDDRRADSLAARLLDHAPAVHARKHQVEHADVGLLVAETGEPRL